jgi:MoxR-like ATPase
MLAYSLASELKLGEVIKIPVKSTSRARDLLYRVNALRRLQDAQRPSNTTAERLYPYLSLEPLGEAIRQKQRRVVLIDEIDKADIDFPNDLLDVFENYTFVIDDLPEEERDLCEANKGFGKVVSGAPGPYPIVVITSNREKRLPEAFLRRCLYVRLRFPDDPAVLADIVRKNTRLTAREWSDTILNVAIAAFLAVRRRAAATQKPPSTSELIDWVRILHWKGIKPETLAVTPLRPPHWERLFKTMGDIDSYERISQEQV